MPQNNGLFGAITTDGNKITIEVPSGTDLLGDVAVTSAVGRVQCFWDGTQWVCNSIEFSLSQNPPESSYEQKA
jgi:hypothetical protein